MGSGVGTDVEAAGASLGWGAAATGAAPAGDCRSANGRFSSHSATAARAMAPAAHTATVTIRLRLRRFSISARRLARGDGV